MAAHVLPLRTYLAVFAALMVLLVATVAAALFDFGQFTVGSWNLHFVNVLVMLTIAIVKTLLVVLYFMHVRYSSRLTWVFASAGFLWFAILVTLTLGDYMTRDWLNPDELVVLSKPGMPLDAPAHPAGPPVETADGPHER